MPLGSLKTLRSRLSRSRSPSASSSSSSVTSEKDSKQKVQKAVEQLNLTDRDYFHGVLTRDDTHSMLQKPGDFLLRYAHVADPQSPMQLVVSVKGPTKVQHFAVEMLEGNRVCLPCDKDRHFTSTEDMIDMYHAAKTPLKPDNEEQVVLECPVPRQPWQLKHNDVAYSPENNKLGSGAYGDVFKATLLMGNDRCRKVAIKTLNQDLLITKSDVNEFMNEARLLRTYEHENIIDFLGVVMDRNPIMLVMEYADGGSLLGLLKANPQMPITDRFQHLIEAAQGMRVLEKANAVHRDLAARNCLIVDGVTKIADFGLATQMNEAATLVGLRFATKWLAPEVLNSAVFSVKSDVWSFGVLIWEVFSGGQDPYPGVGVTEAGEAVKEHKLRPEGLASQPPKLVEYMQRCTEFMPDKRLTFLQIKMKLRSLKKKIK